MYSNLESSLSDSTTLRPLRAGLEAAQARARDSGSRVLFSRTIIRDRRAPEPNPAHYERYILWEQADRGFALVALGRAATVTAAGPQRFESIRAQLDMLLAETLIDNEANVRGDLPVALAGFSFESETTRATPWHAFPNGLAIIPRLLYTRIGNDRYLTTNAVVDESTDLNALVSSLSEDLLRAITPSPGDTRKLPELHAVEPDDREEWLENVRSLTGLIGRGEAEKVVLARRYKVEADAPIDVHATLDRLRTRYPGCTVFAVRDGESCFLGATPEMLVRLREGIVSADCLAGSIRRGSTEKEDIALGLMLLADDKERREHAMVVRGLIDSLTGVCQDIDAPETPALKRMANVQHLHTPLRARLAQGHVLELVERLHPTPAVGGLPRERAACLIRQHESFDRSWYAGPLGWLDALGGGEFAVALRSALVEGRGASLYAGCGIVRGSDPACEYEESRLKLSAMLGALGTLDESSAATAAVRVAEESPRVSSWGVREAP